MLVKFGSNNLQLLTTPNLLNIQDTNKKNTNSTYKIKYLNKPKTPLLDNWQAYLISFTSRVNHIEPYNAPLTEEAKDFIDKFEEVGDSERTKKLNCKYLGEGVYSKAYFVPNLNFVIKENKRKPIIPPKRPDQMGSLSHENSILYGINEHVDHSQKGIAYVETENGGQFLISSFVAGKKMDPKTNPIDEKTMDRLLRTLYRLDKSNILNSDLSGSNILITEDKYANLIDFQWGEKTNPSYSNSYYKNFSFPEFEAPNNMTSYEGASLSGYLNRLDNGREFLEKYLFLKSHYCEKKAKKLQELYSETRSSYLPERIEFENLKAYAYTHPTDNVINAELLKMNIIKNHRNQYTFYDENVVESRNMLVAINHCIKAKYSADKLAQLKSDSEDPFINKYFKYMNKYGVFWQTNCRNWYPETLKWIYRVVAGDEYAIPTIYFPEEITPVTFSKDLRRFCVDNKDDKLTDYSKISLLTKELESKFLQAHQYGSSYESYNQVSSLIDNYFKND